MCGHRRTEPPLRWLAAWPRVTKWICSHRPVNVATTTTKPRTVSMSPSHSRQTLCPRVPRQVSGTSSRSCFFSRSSRGVRVHLSCNASVSISKRSHTVLPLASHLTKASSSCCIQFSCRCRGSCDLATSFSRQGSKPAASRMPVDAGHRGGVFRDALREQHKLRGPFMLHREVLNGKSWTYRRSLSRPHKRHCHETQKQQQQVSRRERCAQPLTQFLEVPRGNPFACSSALQTPTCLDPIEEALDRVVQQTCTPFGSHFHWNPMTDLHSSDRQALADSLGPRQTLASTQCPHGRHLACGYHSCPGVPDFSTTTGLEETTCPCGGSPTFSTTDVGGSPLGLRRPLGPPVRGALRVFHHST